MIALGEPYPPPVVIPEDNRVYAIGDIHGRKEVLEILLRMVKKDLCEHPLRTGQKYTYCGLGDYVDRGLDLKGVIDILINLQREAADHVFLEGNHDEDFRRVLRYLKGDREVNEDFVRSVTMSGWDTCASYGVPIRVRHNSEWTIKMVEPLLEKVPPEHVEFFENLPWSASFGRYFFIHAPYTTLKERRGPMKGKDVDAIASYLYREKEPDLLDPNHPIRQKIVVHGDMNAMAARSFEYTDRRIGLSDTIDFYRYNEDEVEHKPWDNDAIERWSHCAVLEKDRTPRFLSASIYEYKGPGG